MIGNDLEIEIIELFRQDLTRVLSIRQISKELGRTYPYIHKKVSEFLEDGIFKQIKIGNSILCSINLQSEQAILLLSINEIKKKNELIKQNKTLTKKILKIKTVNSEVPIQTALQVKTQTIIVTENKFYKKALMKEFSNSLILTREEFQETIVCDYSKFQDHTLLYHNERYFELIGAMEEELEIKYSPLKKT